MIKKICFWCAEAALLLSALFLRFIIIGHEFLGLVFFFLAALLGAYGLLALLIPKYQPLRTVRLVLTICLCLGILIAGVTEALIIRASLGDPDGSCDYIVVLGCMVRDDGPSVSLQNRIDAAYAYLTEHPDVIAVVSGGQGKDEPMSEAQCMYDHLVAMGIDPNRVWIENQATSTWANLQYSLALIEERTGSRPTTIGLISSEYHLFRASLQAKSLGLTTVDIPAKTTLPSQALNHFLREIAGVWHYILLGGQYD